MTPALNPAQAPVPSPCIDVCRIDERSGCCAGCWRTLDEIARWSTMGEDDKRAVWAALARRREMGQRQAAA